LKRQVVLLSVVLALKVKFYHGINICLAKKVMEPSEYLISVNVQVEVTAKAQGTC